MAGPAFRVSARPRRSPHGHHVHVHSCRRQPVFTESERLALGGFLAGYTGLTREAYALNLRQFASWCQQQQVRLFHARRADIECFARDLEARGRARATITRRLSTVAGFYRYAVEEELLDRSPAAHIRRPRLDYESHATGLDRNEIGALLVAAGLGTAGEHALISLLALNGLRVSEVTGASIEALGVERGHRTLVVTRKGGKVVTIPLAPRTARAIDLAVGERSEGPIFLAADGRRLDRRGAGRMVRRVARRAGITKPAGPHTLRHAFITAALDAGVSLRDVQEAASHTDPRTTMRYDRARTHSQGFGACENDGDKQVSAVQLADIGCQVLISGEELVKPCVGIATLLPGNVSGEVLDVSLHSRPVSSKQRQRQAPDLGDQDGLTAVSCQLNLDGRLGRLTRTRISIAQRHQQSSGRLARFHPPEPQTAVVYLRAELTARAQVALNLPVPASEAAGIGQCRPQVTYVSSEPVLHAHDAEAVCRSQAAKDANALGRTAGHMVLLIREWPSDAQTTQRPKVHRPSLPRRSAAAASDEMLFTARAIRVRQQAAPQGQKQSITATRCQRFVDLARESCQVNDVK